VPGRVLKSVACFVDCKQARRARLTHGEVVALRLFTGPMYAKYNEVLRVSTLQESAAQPATGLERTVAVEGTAALEANTYSTTIGLLISGLIKLGRISSPPRSRRAYRGLAGLDLPSAFFTPDEQGFCGVVEPAFLSMSDDEATALRYSGLADGKKATIFELQLGKASLGAEVEWLSQFPHERERILPPWTHLEVVGTPTVREDGVTVVELRPTVFQNVRTVEEVTGARREEIKAHISGLVIDLRNEVGLADVTDSELDQRLAAFEQDLHARLCKYEPEWYHDNGKYKSVFLDVLREVENARSRIADPASSLSRQLASVSARTASTGGAAAGPKPGELSVGTKVEIHSLLQAPELNGVRGEIVDPPPQDPGTGRWSVKIEKEGRLVALKSSNLRLVSTPSLRGAGKKVMAMQRVVQQMQNAVSEQHSKFFQVCHSTTHARAHTHKLAPKAVD